MRFVIPVVLENVFTNSVSLIYSSITGRITGTALTAIGVVNQATNLLAALFCVFTMGAGILTARQVGRGDEAAASRTVEQTLLFSPILSGLLTAMLLGCLNPLIRLLFPGAGNMLVKEGRLYLRFMLFGLPGLVICNACVGVLRAAGDSRSALISTVFTNLVQIGLAYLLITRMDLGIKGAAIAVLVCRYAGCAYAVAAVLRAQRGFRVRPGSVLKPDRAVLKHIFRVGLPVSLDQVAVHAGYVLINSFVVSIGETEAGIVQVLNAVLLFTGVCQNIGISCATTLVGQRAGAGDLPDARRMSVRILTVLELISMALCAASVIFSDFCAGCFAGSEAIRKGSADFMWIMIPYCFVAVGCNVCEPSGRAGGEVNYTMLCTVLCVWLIRVPLSWLCLKVWDLGAKGVYAANITALTVRFALAFFRILCPSWGKKEI